MKYIHRMIIVAAYVVVTLNALLAGLELANGRWLWACFNAGISILLLWQLKTFPWLKWNYNPEEE